MRTSSAADAAGRHGHVSAATVDGLAGGGVGQVRFASLNPGVLSTDGPVSGGLRMNGSTKHMVTSWSGTEPLVLNQVIPKFLPRDTYFVQYALAHAGTLVLGRVRVIVH